MFARPCPTLPSRRGRLVPARPCGRGLIGKDHYPAIGKLDSREALERFPELRDYLARHYRQIQQVEGRVSYSFYVRKEAPSEQGP